MMAGAALSLAGFYLAIFFRHGQRSANLAFVVMAISLVFVARAELGMMNASTPAEFIAVHRSFHLPLAVLIFSIVVFIRCRFGTGRLWLAGLICGLRGVLLVMNYTSPVSLNYSEVSALRFLDMGGGESVAVPVAVTNPWTRLAALSLLLLVWYIVDATVSSWRKGGAAMGRRSAVVGGGFVLAIVGSGVSATLIHEGAIQAPYVVTPAFMLILLGLAYELGSDVVRSGNLAIALLASERQRRQAEERMHLASSAAELGFWEWRVHDNQVWLSPEAHRIVGGNGSPVSTLAQFTERLHADDREGLRRLIHRAVERGVECEGEFRVLRGDGAVRWISARGRVHPPGAAGASLMRGVMFDVTERKRMEFELVQQRNELAHLSRVTMLGELSGSLVHELNQPLAAILSNAQAAQRMLARNPQDIGQVSVILGDIVDDDRRAGEVISRLRSLLRKDEINHEPLELKDVIRDVLRIMRSDFLNRNVTIRERYDAANSRIVGDRVLLQQVFLNLFVNACEAMEHTPRSRKIIEVSTVDDDGQYVEARIADFGRGIPEDELDHIFEPFVSTKSRGMGLGLSVCQTIVTVHGGKLWATSEPDQGAIMHLLLPVNAGGAP